MASVALINPQDPAVAAQARRIVLWAHERELDTMRAKGFAPVARSVEDIQAGIERYLGAFQGRDIVGLLGLGPDVEPDQTLIYLLAVDQNHLREGVAKSLVAGALQLGIGASLSVLAITSNIAAQSLYHGLGFVPYQAAFIAAGLPPMIKLRREAL